MIFIKMIRHEGSKEIHETLDLPSGDGKHIGNDRLFIYDGCFNSEKAIPIFQDDLRKLYEMKNNA